MASGGIADVATVLVRPLPAEVGGVWADVRRGWAERGDADLGAAEVGAAELGSAGTGPGAEGTSAAYGVLFPLRVRPTADTTARTVNATTVNRGRKDFATTI